MATKPTSTFTGIYVSAPGRSSGKTLLSLGISRAARQRGLALQTYKKGPDYIDPLWLGQASGRPCYNLDFWTQSPQDIQSMFAQRQADADLALVEGTMGLHDGTRLDGKDSNAAAAKLLGLPVLLVIDCRGVHRGVAALVHGLCSFDPAVNFSGVVLNRVKSGRHESRIREAIEYYTDVPVVGAISETPSIGISEQELGLVPLVEHASGDQLLDKAAELVSRSCDLDTLLPAPQTRKWDSIPLRARAAAKPAARALRIGLARDAAFHFYYQDDLEELRRQGAELVEISPLTGDFPTDLDGLLLGGGFPERHASTLEHNRAFRESLKSAAEAGLVIRAECGGLMYLARTLEVDGRRHDMVGVLPGDVRMHKRPVGRGYVMLETTEGNELPGHEFHHSTINLDKGSGAFCYRVLRGHGVDGDHDGIRVGNCMATYTHFRHTRMTPWVSEFLQAVSAARQPP